MWVIVGLIGGCAGMAAELAGFPDTGVVGSRAGYRENSELQGQGKGD